MYQAVALRTAPPLTRLDGMLHAALGLAGEVGELVDRVKKIIYQGHEFTSADRSEMKKELGDILWHHAEFCSAIEVGMGVVAEENVTKLKARYPDGFSPERSINR